MWAGARHKWRPGVLAAGALTVVLAAVTVGAILKFFGLTLPIDPRTSCSRHDFGCGVLGGALVTVFAAMVAFTWLILVRVFQIVNWGYAREARTKPSAYVPTAANVAEVVGRDDLCRVIEKELHDLTARRPQVIVGGVGAGKTAVLVRLTEWLAERGAVPVAVRLRDLTADDGFRDLAARRFRSVNEHRFKSDGEADRIWRWLCSLGVIVVLADGLEEAMYGTDSRETSIRQALEDAHRLGLPLVITSRPDDALITLDAALSELGPVDEEQALKYVLDSRQRREGPPIEEQTVRALVCAARVAEMPLYLQLTRDLYARDLLRPSDLTDLDDEHRLDIRLRLLENWRSRLEEGRLQPDPSITTQQREFAIGQLSAVAAAALVMDTLEVKFKSLKGEGERAPLVSMDPAKTRVAANLGARLGIVETLHAGVRFRHSIMQAYLGSLWIREHGLERNDYVAEGLMNGGREFLMALTMASARFSDEPQGRTRRSRVLRSIANRLSRAAASGPEGDGSTDDRRVLLLAAAYEIDRMVDHAPTRTLADRSRRAWPRRSGSSRLVEAKRLAVDRIAEARAHDAYEALYELCIEEEDYRVRLAAAQHLGSGGDVASEALKAKLGEVVGAAAAAKENGFAHMRDDDPRRFCVQGWILPLLAATSKEQRDEVLGLLDQWMKVCDGAPASLDACLAQGFKYEANRVLAPGADRLAREHLIRQAEALVEKTAYWYTRLTLLHAVTLWMLSETPRSSADQREWLSRWSGEHPHPFVSAAAGLCASALAHRNPSPYIWIDETGIVAKLGQQTATVDTNADNSLWLTDSLGWVALKPRAVRLVADALLMLNLTDGLQQPGSGAASQFERIRRASRPALPPCVTHAGERSFLSVLGGEDERSWALPGVTCAGSCEFRLCPYPPTGRTLRPEFSESFCRHVAAVRGRAAWHELGKRELQRFWREMERRARAG